MPNAGSAVGLPLLVAAVRFRTSPSIWTESSERAPVVALAAALRITRAIEVESAQTGSGTSQRANLGAAGADDHRGRAGVKIIKTATNEGENVTHLRIFHGPTVILEDERD